jgi:hypothetical protein
MHDLIVALVSGHQFHLVWQRCSLQHKKQNFGFHTDHNRPIQEAIYSCHTRASADHSGDFHAFDPDAACSHWIFIRAWDGRILR